MTMSRTHRAIARIKRIWAEMDYAQRRLFEIQTGVAVTGPRRSRRAQAEIDWLESLYSATGGGYTSRT